MIVKLTKRQYKAIQPYLDFIKGQEKKPYSMLVAQISDIGPRMRVGLIPGKRALSWVAAATEEIPASTKNRGGNHE
jgi:hypothetical protein